MNKHKDMAELSAIASVLLNFAETGVCCGKAQAVIADLEGGSLSRVRLEAASFAAGIYYAMEFLDNETMAQPHDQRTDKGT